MSVKDDLIAAKALIADPKHWIKGEWVADDDQCFCAWGSLIWLSEAGRPVRPALDALSHATPDDFRCRHSKGTDGRTIAFNDHPDTTHADIMALFDRAIEAAQ